MTKATKIFTNSGSISYSAMRKHNLCEQRTDGDMNLLLKHDRRVILTKGGGSDF